MWNDSAQEVCMSSETTTKKEPGSLSELVTKIKEAISHRHWHSIYLFYQIVNFAAVAAASHGLWLFNTYTLGEGRVLVYVSLTLVGLGSSIFFTLECTDKERHDRDLHRIWGHITRVVAFAFLPSYIYFIYWITSHPSTR